MSSVERSRTERVLAEGRGIVRLEPCWVARTLAPAGHRLGLPESAYGLGERGEICERWLASTTRATNLIGPADEGLSYISTDDGSRLTLREAVELEPEAIMGRSYAATHRGLGRLAKILDYGTRLPYHVHLRARHAALVGRNPKDEAYYFPEGFESGPHPETFFGIHPSIAQDRGRQALLQDLIDWDSDRILRYSRAYVQVPTEGFHAPAGVLHAPGTAVTIELQEDSDVFAMLQGVTEGRRISKELMFHDVRPEDRARFGERFVLELIDWETNADPEFYEHRHLSPLPTASSETVGQESWIFYNTTKFAGKRLVVGPSSSYGSTDPGVYSLLVLSGSGFIGGHRVEGGVPELDELLVADAAATSGVEIVNDDPTRELVILKFFGPDIVSGVPMLPALADADA